MGHNAWGTRKIITENFPKLVGVLWCLRRFLATITRSIPAINLCLLRVSERVLHLVGHHPTRLSLPPPAGRRLAKDPPHRCPQAPSALPAP
ncbi:hypothetical protein GUJ93_ZPchr0010g9823 [Zizania palustris]|uniref:Uncharacterized protein n=1 Tax=Zizania palustris TaxID=103762 RepID=A0A8J6BRA6_ZIZPA|nr:hypothetical protein GUJ93_ZPchr0010g9823 [Zizania palustris]